MVDLERRYGWRKGWRQEVSWTCADCSTAPETFTSTQFASRASTGECVDPPLERHMEKEVISHEMLPTRKSTPTAGRCSWCEFLSESMRLAHRPWCDLRRKTLGSLTESFTILLWTRSAIRVFLLSSHRNRLILST